MMFLYQLTGSGKQFHKQEIEVACFMSNFLDVAGTEEEK